MEVHHCQCPCHRSPVDEDSPLLTLSTVTGQNGIGENGMDKMVWTNGINFYRFQFNWFEVLFSNHKSQKW